MKFRILLAVMLVALVAPVKAGAQQPWLADRRYGEGMGIRTGNIELHPGIAGEVGYDSNYFLRASSEQPLDAFRFRITPSFSVSTLGPQRRAGAGLEAVPPLINFRAGVYAAYNEVIATQAENSDVMADQRHLDAGANLRVEILPQRPVGASLYGDYVRLGEPSNNVGEQWAFDRDTVIAGGLLNFRPGGGLFEFGVGYQLDYNFFERSTYQLYNNTQHSALARARWLFLPRTALLYDGQYSVLRYAREQTTQNDGEILRSRVGLNGLITNRLALLAMLGWGATFYEPRGPIAAFQYDSLLAQAEIRGFLGVPSNQATAPIPVALSSLGLGYLRDFSNGYLGSFFERDRGYLNLSYFLGGVVLFSAEVGFSHLSYPTSFFLDGSARSQPFSSDRIDARVFAEYRVSDTIGINTTVRYDQNLTSMKIQSDPTTNTLEDLEFARWQAYLGLRWFL